MDDTQEQDHYEERLKEVFNSFDASGAGSLCPEELSDLCQSLHLGDATPALLHTLLQNQDRLTARVDFDQFKNALIQVLSSNIEPPEAEPDTLSKPESPELQPKFVKGSKRYGRRSTPEFIEPISDLSEVRNTNPVEEEELEDNYDSAVPRKREMPAKTNSIGDAELKRVSRWNAHETSTEEYEAEGQMHLWNPDEPSTPRGSNNPLSTCLEERLREACDELSIPWDGCAGQTELLAVCEHLGLEINVDVLQSLTGDGVMNVKEFVSRVVNHNKPPTPSASTPYRQLKRHHSTQPFDEGGRRIATPSVLTSTIGMRLFSTLDDGTGFTPVEYILDAWMEEGIENSPEILQALSFSLEGKVSLGDLTMALENELLVAKNGIHQAALASFRAEIRHLLERVDRELREKEKIRSDLEKAEKLKSQLATEVDEHHSAIERTNNLNLRKLEQDHKEKLAALRSELMQEMDQIQQQAGLQREELEAEVEKIREDESFLRDHLSISVKENRRLEMELLDSTEKLEEAQSQIIKLQTNLNNIMKEKFGDLDPGSADLFHQEERIKQLRSSYEAQYRELQDRIDELQSELQEFHSLGRVHQPCHKPLSEELESKSPGMESDPGIGSEEVQPFSMSLEAEMMLEQLKEQHLQEMEDLRNQLESKINEFDKMVEKQSANHEDQKASLALQYQQEVQALREEMAAMQSHAQELQSQLEQAELERTCLERTQAEEREELENLQEEEVGTLRQQLLEAHTCTADLEEQLKALEAQQAEMDENLVNETEELRKQHAIEVKKLKEHVELSEATLEEERKKLQEEKAELEKKLVDDCKREKELLQQGHEDELKDRLEEAKVRFEEERDELVQRLTEQWQKERAQLDEQNNESLQVLLEEEMLRLVREQEEKESKLREQWEGERAQLQELHEEALLERVLQERLQLQEQFEQREKMLKKEWERERLQLEEDYEGMLQDRLHEEREKLETEKEEQEKGLEGLMAEERARLEENHRQAMKELTVKHAEERDALSSMLDKLRDDVAQERREIEISFAQRINEVEDHFSGDQESVAKRFQADVLKLEKHYQSELEALSESHVEQKLLWEAQIQEALENIEEQRRTTEEAKKQERNSLNQEWKKERHELESHHEEEMEELVKKNQQLQSELDEFTSRAQTREIELSRQLNDLHNRLQESLETKDELLGQSEKKALETELLLNQTVDDFQQERAELLSSQSELEEKYNQMLSISERQITERIELLTERDDLKMKMEELERLLKQAAVDFELERKELWEHNLILEDKLKDNLENDREELEAERDVLKIRIKEMEMEFSQVMSSGEKSEEEVGESNETNTFMVKALNTRGSISYSDKEQETCLTSAEICLNIDVVHANSTNQELVCLSPFLVHQDGHVETTTEAIDGVDGGPENIKIIYNEYDEKVPATNNQGDNTQTVKMDATESEEHEQYDTWPESTSVFGDQVVAVPEDYHLRGSSPDEVEGDLRQLRLKFCSSAEIVHEDSESKSCDGHNPHPPVPDENTSDIESINRVVFPEMWCEKVSSLEAFEDEDAVEDTIDGVNKVSCEEENKPQDAPDLNKKSTLPCDETVVDPSVLEEAGDRDELSLMDAEVTHLPNNPHDHRQDVVSDSDCENLTAEIIDQCARDWLEMLDEGVDCEGKKCSLPKLQALYNTAVEENILLHEKISLLQQKTELLENLLSHNSEKIKSGHQILEENYSLKVKMLLLMEHVKELEIKALKMTDLQIRYEDCVCDNAKLKNQNSELEQRVWSLESSVNIFHDFEDQQIPAVDEISRLREENSELSDLFADLAKQGEILSAAGRSEGPTEESLLDNVQPVTDLEGCCEEFEKQNTELRRAITELQDKSQTLNETTQAHRCETSRLAEKNLVLRQKIAALKEEESKVAQEELIQRLEHLKKGKLVAQKAAENFKKQISKLRLQSQKVEDENRMLSEKNAQNIEDIKNLRQQLAEQIKENERREAFPVEEKDKLAACVSALEAELTKALEDTAELEERNTQLSQQVSGLRDKAVKVESMGSQLAYLVEERKSVDKENQDLRDQQAKAQERVKTVDETLQTVNHQSARLKSDLRVVQQEKDSLQHEVAVLRKQLQNVNDKNHVLEMALHSSGLQHQSKKLYRDEMSRLMEQDQQLLRQENERLQAEVFSIKGDLVQSREKVRQLDVTVQSLKQHKQPSQSSLLKALEQENASLKQELETQKELTKGREAGQGLTELESLQQENEALRTQMAGLSTQLLETFQAQLVGLLPPSPHRMPRGQHRGEDPDNMQDERERKMKNMEERLREIELSLHNVKLLLKDKVAQLKDQLHKNGKADVLIQDLYVENSQLIKALDITKQRQKLAEKKNYLLEEKISSLNKIVRDLNPSSLPSLPYHYTCS